MKLPSKIEYPDEMNCDQMGRYKTFRIFKDVEKGFELHERGRRADLYAG